MMCIEFYEATKAVTIRMAGRFVGRFAESTRELVAGCTVPSRLVVNLSEVTFVDAIGEEVLSWLGQIGAEFLAEKVYPLEICGRLHLPMARRIANDSPRRYDGGRKRAFR
jgi:hypothetical protein